MTWQDATHKRKTWQRQRITGRHLAHRSRGVTTLHHYERISSWDLEWHRRENGRESEEVKLSCFFDKRVRPKNVVRLSNLKEEYNGGEHNIFYLKCAWKASLGEGSNGVVGKPTTKRVSLLWAYEKNPKIMRWNSATNGNNGLDWINKETRNLFHQEDK